MKRILIPLALMAYFISGAQEIRYPSEVRKAFESADEKACQSIGSKPLIGIPEALPERSVAVLEAGGIPVMVPGNLDSEEYAVWCSRLDGLSIGDRFVTEGNEQALYLYKAAIDRNLPVLGRNALMDKINAGLWRSKKSASSTEGLINDAILYRKASELHKRIFTLDTHADLPCGYKDGYHLGRRAVNQVSLRKMDEGGLDGTFIVCFLGQKEKKDEGEASLWCEEMLRTIRADIDSNAAYCSLATGPEDALAAKREGKKACFIGIENGFCIGNDISNIRKYADLGVRYITLSHTWDNHICHTSSHHSADTTLGLTLFGIQAVKEMNRCGILVDCSHTSSGTFWDCLNLSQAPVICSHSGCKALFDHDRNLTDDQLRALAGKGGVVQIYAVWNFQGEEERGIDIETFLDHIDHAVNVAGIDHVGIGIDMDGGGGYTGIFGANDAINITIGLLKRGYSPNDIAKIWSGNFFRVMKEAEKVASELRNGN